MSKYYTPQIEELFIGFEYQQFSHLEGKWKETSLNYNQFITILDEERCDWSEHNIRVKRLDSDDIESLGFEKDNNRFWDGGNYDILFDSNSSLVMIREIFYESTEDTYDIKFDGTIKNKSEFKQVLNMIGIWQQK